LIVLVVAYKAAEKVRRQYLGPKKMWRPKVDLPEPDAPINAINDSSGISMVLTHHRPWVKKISPSVTVRPVAHPLDQSVQIEPDSRTGHSWIQPSWQIRPWSTQTDDRYDATSPEEAWETERCIRDLV
jgi:hypothetical protein